MNNFNNYIENLRGIALANFCLSVSANRCLNSKHPTPSGPHKTIGLFLPVFDKNRDTSSYVRISRSRTI